MRQKALDFVAEVHSPDKPKTPDWTWRLDSSPLVVSAKRERLNWADAATLTNRE
jgi:hypothetical protein